MEGEGDADIGAVLAELAPLLTGSAEARAAFELRPGYPLALYCFTEAYSPLAAAVLQAASGRQSAPQPAPAPEEAALGEQGGTVLWPAAVWQRLLTTALAGSSAPLAAAAMQLLAWAAGDPWARCQVLAHPFPGGAGSGGQRCPAEQVATALQQLSQSGLQPAAVTAAVELLGRWVGRSGCRRYVCRKTVTDACCACSTSGSCLAPQLGGWALRAASARSGHLSEGLCSTCCTTQHSNHPVRSACLSAPVLL